MEWTIGRIMGLIAFLFGIAVGAYFIFRPKDKTTNIVIDGSGLDDNNRGLKLHGE